MSFNLIWHLGMQQSITTWYGKKKGAIKVFLPP
jgi:hypothetical protein